MHESALSIDLADESSTERLGGALAMSLDSDRSRPMAVLHLRGDLGAGKTTLARGFLRALGWQGTVRSPTYTLLETYDLSPWTLIHIDLYRLNAPGDLEDLGLRDFLHKAHALLIEWPEQGAEHTPPADLDIHISYAGSARRSTVTARSDMATAWLERFSAHDKDSN